MSPQLSDLDIRIEKITELLSIVQGYISDTIIPLLEELTSQSGGSSSSSYNLENLMQYTNQYITSSTFFGTIKDIKTAISTLSADVRLIQSYSCNKLVGYEETNITTSYNLIVNTKAKRYIIFITDFGENTDIRLDNSAGHTFTLSKEIVNLLGNRIELASDVDGRYWTKIRPYPGNTMKIAVFAYAPKLT